MGFIHVCRCGCFFYAPDRHFVLWKQVDAYREWVGRCTKCGEVLPNGLEKPEVRRDEED